MYRDRFASFGYFMTPWVKRLMIANTVLLLLMWVGLIPAQWAYDHLGFNASQILTEPWTLVTYMFVHGGFWHLLLNMLFLFFFGPPLEQRWGGTEFIKYYMICGMGGAVLSLIFEVAGATGSANIIGASGAIYGVLLAYALNWPDNPIWIWGIFPVKAKYLVMFLGGIAFLSAFSASQDGVAHFAHLGGLVVGYVYLKRGWAVSVHLKSLRKRLLKRKFSVIPGGAGKHPVNGSPSGRSDEEARIHEAVDKLLDKIASDGLESLTQEERRFLDEVSRRRQMRH